MQGHWENKAYGGGLFEQVVACLLGLENNGAIRIVAARGDGGVDICLWDGDGWIIYQCKYHCRKIAWTKIDASLANLAAGTFLGSPVKQWWLVPPHNPTTAKYERLLKIGNALPFPGWVR